MRFFWKLAKWALIAFILYYVAVSLYYWVASQFIGGAQAVAGAFGFNLGPGVVSLALMIAPALIWVIAIPAYRAHSLSKSAMWIIGIAMVLWGAGALWLHRADLNAAANAVIGPASAYYGDFGFTFLAALLVVLTVMLAGARNTVAQWTAGAVALAALFVLGHDVLEVMEYYRTQAAPAGWDLMRSTATHPRSFLGAVGDGFAVGTPWFVFNADHFRVLGSFVMIAAGMGGALLATQPARVFKLKTGADGLIEDGAFKARFMPIKKAAALLNAPNGAVIGEAAIPSEPGYKPGSAPLLQMIPNGHLRTLAPTRSGKTTAYVIPTLLKWTGPVIVFDPKFELFQKCRAAREAMGRKVYVINPRPRPALGEYTDGFNPLEWIYGGGTDAELVENLKSIQSLLEPDGEDKGDPHFTKRGGDIANVYATTLAEQRRGDGGFTMREWYSRLAHGSREELGDFADAGGIVADAAAELSNVAADETWSGYKSNADKLLSFMKSPGVRAILGEAPTTFQLEEIFRGEADLFINISLANINANRPLAKFVIGSILFALMDRQKKIDPRLLFLIDEFPTLGKIPAIETGLALTAGMGCTIWMLSQDFAQEQQHYGKEGARIIENNCVASMYLQAREPEICEHISKRCGHVQVADASTTAGEGGQSGLREVSGRASSNYGRSEKALKRRLIEADEVRQMPPNEQIIIMDQHQPIRCGIASYFLRPDLDRQVDDSNYEAAE